MPELENWSFSMYYMRLQEALEVAVDDYERLCREAAEREAYRNQTMTTEQIRLMNAFEARRSVIVLVTAALTEGVANLYLRLRATPTQLEILERCSPIEKWTVAPTYFVPTYQLDKSSLLYQDLRRVHLRRNAIAHLKEEVTRGEGLVHPSPHPPAAGDEHIFVVRCRTLAMRLISHLATFDRGSEIAALELSMRIANPTSRE